MCQVACLVAAFQKLTSECVFVYNNVEDGLKAWTASKPSDGLKTGRTAE